MKEINYKKIDRKLILEYVEKQGGQCSVQDIINNSGAEKLRVYNILSEEVIVLLCNSSFTSTSPSLFK